MLAGIGLMVLALIGVAVFMLYNKLTGARPEKVICHDLTERIQDKPGLLAAIRDHYPPDTTPPAPGSMVTLFGKQPVADTPMNVCRHNLFIWHHRLRRNKLVKLLKCVDKAKTTEALGSCYQPFER